MYYDTKAPLIISSVIEMISFREKLSEQNSSHKATVGFVPTMGALHQGHACLLDQSKKENDISVLSIFVNPTQFNDKTDFDKYPKTFEADIKIAQAHGVDVVFCPPYEDLYPDGYKYKVTEDDFSLELCGASRPGHFDGVLSVVMKLFQIVKPTRSYFGEKDHQQLSLIKGMAQAFFLPLEIVPVPTQRELSGLAMSSRNTRLSDQGRRTAALIYKTITEVKDITQAKDFLTQSGFDVDYLVDKNGRRYVAAFLEGVRLIDNVKIP